MQYFLTGVTFLSMASLTLVLQITLPWVGGYAFALCGAAPFAGKYYWENAEEQNYCPRARPRLVR